MFERHRERARRTVFFARYEASHFGSPYIESEHLLLGILREDRALMKKFLAPDAALFVRERIEKDTPVRTKVSTSIDLPLSDECKRILTYGAQEAESLGRKHIDSAHLLIGVLTEKESFGARILRELGLELNALREELHRSESSPRPPTPLKLPSAAHLTGWPPGPGIVRYTEPARMALFLARYEASQFSSPQIESEHLLLGVLFEDSALAARILLPGESVDSLRKRLPLPQPAGPRDPKQLGFSDECQRIIESARENSGTEPVTLGDLLASILQQEHCVAAKILQGRGSGTA